MLTFEQFTAQVRSKANSSSSVECKNDIGYGYSACIPTLRGETLHIYYNLTHGQWKLWVKHDGQSLGATLDEAYRSFPELLI